MKLIAWISRLTSFFHNVTLAVKKCNIPIFKIHAKIRKMKNEHIEATKLATKLNWLLKDALWFKIANERQHAKDRLYLAAEGVRAGVPDILIVEPRQGYHGLFLELKRLDGGNISKAQKEFASAAEQRGYKVIFPKGATEAFNSVKSYLGLDNELI